MSERDRAVKLLHYFYEKREEAAANRDLQTLVVTGEVIDALSEVVNPRPKKKGPNNE